MTARFHRRKAIADSLRTIATDAIAQALAALDDPQMPEAEVTHLVRQQLKRLRALIRLPRGQFSAFRSEDRAFRDLGRRLAGSRDAEVLGVSFDAMVKAARLSGLHTLRAHLVGGLGRPLESAALRELLREEIAPGLFAALRRVRKWRLQTRGFTAIGAGLLRTYGAMRRDQAETLRYPDPAKFHQWRKQVKYHANQLAFLRPAALDVIKGSLTAAQKLADILGEHHDLEVLRSALLNDRCVAVERAALLATIAARSARLQAEAFRLGDELTAESPGDFRRRIRQHWRKWRR